LSAQPDQTNDFARRAAEALFHLFNQRRTNARAAGGDTALRHRAARCGGGCTALTHGRGSTSLTVVKDRDTPESSARVALSSDLARRLRFGRPVTSEDWRADPRYGRAEPCPGVDAGPALFVPVRSREQEPGYLALFRARGQKPFLPDDIRTALMLAAWLSGALENLRLAERVEKLAVTDDLTQVFNYRFLKTALRRELKRAARFQQPLSIIMVDGHRRPYNDRHAHLRGSYFARHGSSAGGARPPSWDLRWARRR
jgi:GAF domain-containing protein